MALPQRDKLIDEIHRLEGLMTYAEAHGEPRFSAPPEILSAYVVAPTRYASPLFYGGFVESDAPETYDVGLYRREPCARQHT